MGCLLPNIRGQNEKLRKLYTGVLRSIVLYRAPIWADSITAGGNKILRWMQRQMALRIIRTYRTVSHEVALALAGMVPFQKLAEIDAAVFHWATACRRNGVATTKSEIAQKDSRRKVGAVNMERGTTTWRGPREAPANNKRSPAALGRLDELRSRNTHKTTQVLTGHASISTCTV